MCRIESSSRYDWNDRANWWFDGKARGNCLRRSGFNRLKNCGEKVLFSHGSRDVQTIGCPVGTRFVATKDSQGMTVSRPSVRIDGCASRRSLVSLIAHAHGGPYPHVIVK